MAKSPEGSEVFPGPEDDELRLDNPADEPKDFDIYIYKPEAWHWDTTFRENERLSKESPTDAVAPGVEPTLSSGAYQWLVDHSNSFGILPFDMKGDDENWHKDFELPVDDAK